MDQDKERRIKELENELQKERQTSRENFSGLFFP